MTTNSESAFVNANIHIYAITWGAPEHQRAVSRLAQLDNQQTPLWVSPQVIRESLRALLRSPQLGPISTYGAILELARQYFSQFNLAPETTDVVTELHFLLESYQPPSADIHDTNIVATMRVHGIRRILTNNPSDFVRFAGLIDIESL